jgi:cell division protein FtsZ
MIQFDLPKEQSSIIKVIGVGGGGSNAVNHMFGQNIEGVNFIICNTDAQAIALSKVPNKVQLGPHLTQGLGAGANPNIGRQATEESLEEIKRILEVNTKMAFITAGMGGGTGTGGAPIIAQICKELGILTVGIVTTPFAYEGKKRLQQAQEGINLLKENVDTLLVISNDKLRHQFGNLKMKEAFGRADNVLATAAKCITDVINSTGQINVDFADVCTVMKDGGVAILGSAAASGENRAQTAIENALTSPLLNDCEIKGAKWILININSAEGDHEFSMDEVEIIQNHLLSQAGEDTDVIMGLGYDNSLGSDIGITLIATGFEQKDPFAKEAKQENLEDKDKVVLHLDLPKATPVAIPVTKEIVIENIVEERILTPLVVEQQTEAIIEEPVLEVVVAVTENVVTTETVITVADVADPMMPTLKIIEEANAETETIAVAMKEEVAEEPKVFFEISSSVDQIPTTTFQFVEVNETVEMPKAVTITATQEEKSELKIQQETENKSNLSSGGFLTKPTQIYAEEKPAILESNTTEEPLPVKQSIQEDEPAVELQLVVKESTNAAEESVAQPTQPIMKSPVEDTALQDETEELRRRANERLAKLRNLSFNVNATDPNNEFETVPAYLRRNMEMQVQLAEVENFYSNYTVKPTENNQADISTINTFLDGKKPD